MSFKPQKNYFSHDKNDLSWRTINEGNKKRLIITEEQQSSNNFEYIIPSELRILSNNQLDSRNEFSNTLEYKLSCLAESQEKSAQINQYYQQDQEVLFQANGGYTLNTQQSGTGAFNSTCNFPDSSQPSERDKSNDVKEYTFTYHTMADIPKQHPTTFSFRTLNSKYISTISGNTYVRNSTINGGTTLGNSINNEALGISKSIFRDNSKKNIDFNNNLQDKQHSSSNNNLLYSKNFTPFQQCKSDMSNASNYQQNQGDFISAIGSQGYHPVQSSEQNLDDLSERISKQNIKCNVTATTQINQNNLILVNKLPINNSTQKSQSEGKHVTDQFTQKKELKKYLQKENQQKGDEDIRQQKFSINGDCGLVEPEIIYMESECDNNSSDSSSYSSDDSQDQNKGQDFLKGEEQTKQIQTLQKNNWLNLGIRESTEFSKNGKGFSKSVIFSPNYKLKTGHFELQEEQELSQSQDDKFHFQKMTGAKQQEQRQRPQQQERQQHQPKQQQQQYPHLRKKRENSLKINSSLKFSNFMKETDKQHLSHDKQTTSKTQQNIQLSSSKIRDSIENKSRQETKGVVSISFQNDQFYNVGLDSNKKQGKGNKKESLSSSSVILALAQKRTSQIFRKIADLFTSDKKRKTSEFEDNHKKESKNEIKEVSQNEKYKIPQMNTFERQRVNTDFPTIHFGQNTVQSNQEINKFEKYPKENFERINCRGSRKKKTLSKFVGNELNPKHAKKGRGKSLSFINDDRQQYANKQFLNNLSQKDEKKLNNNSLTKNGNLLFQQYSEELSEYQQEMLDQIGSPQCEIKNLNLLNHLGNSTHLIPINTNPPPKNSSFHSETNFNQIGLTVSQLNGFKESKVLNFMTQKENRDHQTEDPFFKLVTSKPLDKSAYFNTFNQQWGIQIHHTESKEHSQNQIFIQQQGDGIQAPPQQNFLNFLNVPNMRGKKLSQTSEKKFGGDISNISMSKFMYGSPRQGTQIQQNYDTHNLNYSIHPLSQNASNSFSKCCQICGTKERELIELNKKCYHLFCVYCLKSYIECKIQSNEVLRIRCPIKDCKVYLRSSSYKQFISVTLFKKYKHLKKVLLQRQNPNIRYCTRENCNGYMIGDIEHPKLICPECGQQICFHCCNNYHQGKRCDQAFEEELENRQEEYRLNCPKCLKRTSLVANEDSKYSNKKTCTLCQYSFCNLCLRECGKFHFAPWNLCYGCPGRKYDTGKKGVVQKIYTFIWGVAKLLIYCMGWIFAFICYPIAVAILSMFMPLGIYAYYNGKKIHYCGWKKHCLLFGLFLLGIILYPIWVILSIAPGTCLFFKDIYWKKEEEEEEQEEEDKNMEK